MMLFLILAAAIPILVAFFLESMKSSSPKAPLKQIMAGKKQKKRRIVCKSRKDVTFKPEFKNKQLKEEPKLVYMTFIYNSIRTTAVIHSHPYNAHQRKTARLFDMHFPEEKEDNESEYLNYPLYCKGLFVLATANSVLVSNPATKQVITLPQSNKHTPRPNLLEFGGRNIRTGFGFLQSTHAYKVVQYFYRSHDLKRRRYSMGFEVFTVGVSSSWRVLANDPPYPIRSSCSFYSGKCVYFIIWRHIAPCAPNAFLCFDLRSERFSIMHPPVCVMHAVDVSHTTLTDLQGSICLSFFTANNTKLVLFTSKKGNSLDWTPTFCFSVGRPPGYVFVRPVVTHGGNVLILLKNIDRQSLVLGHTEDGSVEEVNGGSEDVEMEKEGFAVDHGKPWSFVARYEESLFKLPSQG